MEMMHMLNDLIDKLEYDELKAQSIKGKEIIY